MAVIPPVKRIVGEEFPDQKGWIGKLLSPVNSFFEAVHRALNKGITIKENVDGEIRTVTLDGTYPYKLAWERKSAPSVAWIGSIREQDGNHTTITTAVFLDWEYTSDGNFQINNVTGVSPSGDAKFIAKLIILVG